MNRAKLTELPADTIQNINQLVPSVNLLLEAFGEYRRVTSGYRTKADQDRINPKASKSKHCIGAAVDLEDRDGKLAAFITKRLELIKQLGLWFEDPKYTKGWVHCQCLPPASGKRFFIP